MPKMRLEYDLDTERNAAEIAVKSLDYAIAWTELREWLRQKIKYGAPTVGKELFINEIREYIHLLETDRQLPEVE